MSTSTAPIHEVDVSGEPSGSLDSIAEVELAQDIDALAEKAGEALAVELSAWFADIEGRRLASERLGEVISDWETEHGSFTPDELEAARTQHSG